MPQNYKKGCFRILQYVWSDATSLRFHIHIEMHKAGVWKLASDCWEKIFRKVGFLVKTLFNHTIIIFCFEIIHRKYSFLILFLIFNKFVMENWFCTLTLYFNKYKSKDLNSEKLRNYRFPREDSNIQP